MSAIVYWVELEVPDAPGTIAIVHWAEFETPDAPILGDVAIVYWAEFEVPDVTSAPGTFSASAAPLTLPQRTHAMSGGGVPIFSVTRAQMSLFGGVHAFSGGAPPQPPVIITDPGNTHRGAVVGGLITVDSLIYRASFDNVWLEDISNKVDGGSIEVDTLQPSMMSFSANGIARSVLTPYQDWIAPVMRLTYPDPDGYGDITITNQLGLYMAVPPVKEFSEEMGVPQIEGRDALWKMTQSGPGYAYGIASGQNITTRIRTVCNLAGVRHQIQHSDELQPKRRTWPWNATWLDIANDLARSIGFVPLFPDRTGRVRTNRYRSLHQGQPAREFRNDTQNVLETITLEPDLSRLCNHVVVVGNDPKTDVEIFARRLNDDPTSPTSTVNLGTNAVPFVKSIFEEDPNIEKQSAANDRADYLMDHGSGVLERMEIVTMPVTDWLIGDTIKCDLETDEGELIANGTWRWEKLSMGLGLDCETHWTMAKLVRWQQVSV